MKPAHLLIPLAFFAASAAQAQSHPCAADAARAAGKLLRLHADGDDRASVGERIRKIGTVKPLVGAGALDVLEAEGSVYKASYRIRLIYAQIPGSCALMGQEILERSNPY
jgi:hypothetical protein